MLALAWALTGLPAAAQGDRWIAHPQAGRFVTAIAADGQGRLWLAGEEQGVFRFDGASWTRFDTRSSGGLLDGFCRALAVDGNGHVWCGTGRKGVAVYDGNAWRKYDLHDGLAGWHVHALAVSPRDGRVWIGTEAGISAWDGMGFSGFTAEKDGLCSNQIADIAFHRETGHVWIGGAENGLCRLEGGRWKTFNREKSPLVSDQVNALCLDSRQHLWIATHGGLARINLRAGSVNWTTHDIPVELTDRYYTSVAEDAAGNIWAGTRRHGAWRLDVKSGLWEPFDRRNAGLPDDYVSCLLALPDGTVWAGTYGGGAAKIRPVPVVAAPGDPRWRRPPQPGEAR